MKATLNEIILSNAQVKLREDGIIQINIADNASISLKEMKEIVATIKKITKGIPHPVLKLCGKGLGLICINLADVCRYFVEPNVCYAKSGRFFYSYDG